MEKKDPRLVSFRKNGENFLKEVKSDNSMIISLAYSDNWHSHYIMGNFNSDMIIDTIGSFMMDIENRFHSSDDNASKAMMSMIVNTFLGGAILASGGMDQDLALYNLKKALDMVPDLRDKLIKELK